MVGTVTNRVLLNVNISCAAPRMGHVSRVLQVKAVLLVKVNKFRLAVGAVTEGAYCFNRNDGDVVHGCCGNGCGDTKLNMKMVLRRGWG